MKKRILVIVSCFAIALYTSAQQPVDTAVIRKIKEEEKNHSQVAMLAHNLTDVCGPRLTNSPGYRQAVTWLTQTANTWGLKNTGKEAWGTFGRGWSNDETLIAMKQPYYENMIGYPVPWCKSTNGMITSNAVILNSLDSASIDSAGNSLQGKIVVIKPGSKAIPPNFKPDAKRYTAGELDTLPDQYMYTKKDMEEVVSFFKHEYYTRLYLEKKGAAALISSFSRSVDGTVIVDALGGYAKDYAPTLPELQITREDNLKLVRLVQDNHSVGLNLLIKNTVYDKELTGYNFVAELPGSDANLKNEVVMIGAHLDSWASGTGATDNAAGCVIMMEAMRILQALHLQPRRTIRVALWDGEEEGLLGSFGYVKKHFGNPADMKLTPEQKNISAYYNLDNGTGKIRGIYLQNNDSLRSLFKTWLAPFADMDATGVTRSNTGSTDHLSFDAVGIPAFQFMQDELDYETRTHHTNMDVYDHLSIEDLQQAAVIVASFVYNTAMYKDLLPRKPLPEPGRFIFDTDFPL